jgi:hypothetical protein
MMKFLLAIAAIIALSAAAYAQPIATPPSIVSVYAAATNTASGITSYGQRVGNGQSLNVYNTAFGFHALDANVNAQEHTAIGYLALAVHASGVGNTAIGYNVLPRDTQGSFETGVGSDVLRYFDSTQNGNSAFGHGALAGDDTAPLQMTGGGNTAIGGWTGQEMTTGGNNTLVGRAAGQEVQTGNENVATGVYALLGCNGCANNIAQANAASFNVALGAYALENSSANGQTAVGYRALTASTTGILSTAIGYNVLAASVNDVRNTAVGYDALLSVNGASDNTVAGAYALNIVTTGGQNTAIGSAVGTKLTTGTNNTLLGAYVGSTTLATGSFNILIGVGNNCDTAAASTSSTFLVCAASGSVPLISASLSNLGGVMRLNATGGDTYFGSATALNAVSVQGYMHFPSQTAAPTATPNATDVACAWNTATHVLNCRDGATWYKIAGTAGAG